MNIVKMFLCLFFVLAAGAGLALAQRDDISGVPSAAEKPSTARIKGRIIYGDNGKPVRRGVITLRRAEYLEPVSGVKALTDDRGRFVISGVPAGNYYPIIEVAGILNITSYPSFAGMSGQIPRISARKAGAVFDVITTDGVNDIEIVIPVKRAAAIGGRVTYFDGEVAAGLQVEAVRKSRYGYENSSESYSYKNADAGFSITDDRGFYRFSGLPPGEYLILVREKARHTNDYNNAEGVDRNAEIKTFYRTGESGENAAPVELFYGSEADGIDITIPDRRTFDITGTLISKGDKKPVSSARLQFERIDPANPVPSVAPYLQRAYTEPGGKWAIKDLPPGKYRIEFMWQKSYRDDEKSNEKAIARPGRTAVFVDVVDRSQDITVELPNEATISGTIRLENDKILPAIPLFVLAFEEGDERAIAFNIDALKEEKNAKMLKFTIDQVPTGKKVRLGVSSNERRGLYVKSIKLGSVDLMSSALTIEDGQETKGVEIVLSDKIGTLKGKISREPTSDLPNVLILPVSGNESETRNRMKTLTVDENGRFECDLAPGEYYVGFYKAPFSLDEPWREAFKRQIEGASRIMITEGETVSITVETPGP